MWQVVTGGGDHHAEVTVDQSGMQATLDDLEQRHRAAPGGGRRSRSATARRPGVRRAGLVVVSRGATQSLLERRFLHGGSQKLPTEVEQPDISDDEVARGARGVRQAGDVGPGDARARRAEGRRATARCSPQGLSMEAEDGELEPRVDGELMLEALEPVMRTIGREPRGRRGSRSARASRGSCPAKVGVEIDPAGDRGPVRRGRRAAGRGARGSSSSGKATQPVVHDRRGAGAEDHRAGQHVHHELPLRRVPQRQPAARRRADRRHRAASPARPSASTTRWGSAPRPTASPRATSSPTASSRRTSAAASRRSRRPPSTRCTSPASRTSSTSRTRSTSTATPRVARRRWPGRRST